MSEIRNTPGRGSPPSMPRWVKVLVVLFVVLVLFIIVLHLMGFRFGGHGADRTLYYASALLNPL